MKKAALPAGLMLVAAGIVGGIVAFMGSEVRLADKAPQGTTLWLEAQDLSASWKNFKKSDAFKDFESSKSYAELNKGWQQMVELAKSDQQFKEMQEIGLALNEANVLNFLGQNVALGLIAGDGSDRPRGYAMTRIDVLGLAKEIAVDGNWKQVWDKLQNLLGGENVTKTSYKGFDIATRTFPVPTKTKEKSVHFCMMEDVLVVSDAESVVKSIIDVHKGDAPSLSKLPAFDDEVDALDRGKIAYAWADVGLLRDKPRVAKIVQALGASIDAETGNKQASELAKKFTGEELNVLIEDLHADVSGLAVGLHAPGANPYLAHFAGSRPTEEIFKDSTTNDIRCLAGDDTMFLFETKNLFELAIKFVNSKTAATLQKTEAWQWARKKMEDPAQLAAVGGMRGMKESPLFEVRTGLALGQALLKELLGESLAIVVGTKEAKKPEDMFLPAAYYRPRPVVRLAADLALGFAAAHGELSKTERADEGAYPAFSIKPDKKGPTLHVARIGADFLFTTQREILAAAVAKAGKKGEFASEALKDSLGKVPPGYQMLAYVDYSRYAGMMKTLMPALTGGRGAPPADAKMMDKVYDLYNIYGPSAQAFYVSNDFTTWSFRAYQGHNEKADARIKKLYQNVSDAPAVWKQMPEGTFASMTWQTNPTEVYSFAFDMIKGLAPEKEFEKGFAEVKKQMGMDPKDLVAHLGGEMGLAITAQDRLVPKGAPAEQAKMMLAVPAALVYVELKSAAGFQKDALPLLKKAITALNAEREGGSERRVIATLKSISNAQSLFREGDKDGDGKLFYATRLRDLGKAGLVDPMIASGFHHGYRFKLQRTPKDKGEFTWMCIASPFMGEKGRHFAVTHDGIVYHALKAFELSETCTVPKDAVPLGQALPNAPVKKKDANDPNLFRLVESNAGDATVWELALPQKDASQLGPVGEGVKPCFAITGTHLIISTSRAALQQALEAPSGANLLKNQAFKDAVKDQPTQVALFSHFALGGVLDQIQKNSRFIALQVASPSNEDVKKPVMPDWKGRKSSPKDFDAKFEQYQKDQRTYRKTVAKWREDKADENAAILDGILDSLRSLGAFVMWARNTKDEKAIESYGHWKFDLAKVKPAKAK